MGTLLSSIRNTRLTASETAPEGWPETVPGPWRTGTGARSCPRMGDNLSVTSLRSAPVRRGRSVADPACVEAVDLALEAAKETARPSEVGEHQGYAVEGDRVVTHFFACTDFGYRGWRWAVTVTRAARAKVVTVSETALLPGEEAVLPPEWVPWLDRLRPGDLGPGDLLPTAPDDARLAPGFAQPEEDLDEQAQWELGLGRARVLSAEGRDQAAERWYEGAAGPQAPIAVAAPAQCSTCGFYLLLSGGMRRLFGVCANEHAPDDGRAVSADHGCGAHSEAVVAPSVAEVPPLILDEMALDELAVAPEGPEPPEDEVSDEEALGHS